jgi:transcriptional regulator with XRE-family HTH domain
MKLGIHLLEVCKRKGMSLTELAKKTGVPKTTLHGWTTGRSGLKPEQLRIVANYLRVSFYELLFGEPDPYEADDEEELTDLFHGDIRVTIHRVNKIKKCKK